jgi:hypothetical protein
MMNSLELGGDGKTVSLAFSVPSEVIDLLGAMGARHHGAEPDDPDADPDPDFDFDTPPVPPTPPTPPVPPQPPRPSRW